MHEPQTGEYFKYTFDVCGPFSYKCLTLNNEKLTVRSVLVVVDRQKRRKPLQSSQRCPNNSCGVEMEALYPFLTAMQNFLAVLIFLFFGLNSFLIPTEGVYNLQLRLI